MHYTLHYCLHGQMKFYLISLLTVFSFRNVVAQFEYVSPMPGSTLINPGHNIILREGHAVNKDLLNKDLFTIDGAISGRHAFNMTLSSDEKTVILTPVIPFEFNEMVTVTVRKAFCTAAGKLSADFSFNFTTHRRYTAEEQDRIQSQLLKSRTEEMPAVATTSETRSAMTGAFEITVNNSPSPGDIFFDAWNSSIVYKSVYDGFHIITTAGDSVYSSPGVENQGFEWDLNPDGHPAHWNATDESFDVLDSNYQVIDKYAAVNGYYTDPHEFILLPDGHAFLIASDILIYDMTVYDPEGSEECAVTGSIIQEFDEDKNLVFEWRSFDHISPDQSNQDLTLDNLDYAHTNSLEIDSDGNIIASHRHLDEISKINRQTGEFIWRLGGKMNQFTFVNDTEGFCYQHDARRIVNGHLTLWDNGDSHAIHHSAAKEYNLDAVNHTATLVWSYSPAIANTGEPVYFYGMGNVQRLDNGNTFINGGWATNPEQSNMWEVTPEGEVVWELKLNDDSLLISYRAHKRQWNPCALVTPSGIHITALTSRTTTLEWRKVSNAVSYNVAYKMVSETEWHQISLTDTLIQLQDLIPSTVYTFQLRAACLNGFTSDWSPVDTFKTEDTASIPDLHDLKVYLHPNLTHDNLFIGWNLPVSATFDVTVLDASGRENMETTFTAQPGDVEALIDISNLQGGIYFLQLKCESHDWLLPFVKQ